MLIIFCSKLLLLRGNQESKVYSIWNWFQTRLNQKERKRTLHNPREWFIVPLDITDRAIELVIEERLYNPTFKPFLINFNIKYAKAFFEDF